MIKDENLILLLQIIKTNGKVDSLLKKGLEYSQIAVYLRFAIDNKYANINNGMLSITDEGVDKLASLNASYGRFKQNSWISPLEEYKIKKMNKFDIYLPDEVR